MKILFLSSLYTKKEVKEIINLSNMGLQEAANTFQWNIINGLEENLGMNIDIINTLPIGSYPKNYKKLVIKSHEWSHKKNSCDFNIGFINIFGIKQYIRFVKYKKMIKKWLKKNENEKEKYIIIYSLYTPFLQAISNLKKKYKDFKVCVIIPDLPSKLGMNRLGKGILKVIEKIDADKQFKLIKEMDCYVLLTEYMNEVLKIENKPSVVIEGMINLEELEHNYEEKTNNDKKVILYTGRLYEKYGIKNLLQAFSSIKKSNYELWICGNGDMNNEIYNVIKHDERIKFFGQVVREKSLQLQKRATVLINPRNSTEVYTKYSFPSKTIEYLMSGNPVVVYKLQGIPSEYDKYLYYIEGDSYINMANKLIEVCEMNEIERSYKGYIAKKFIINNKNNIVQTGKIINILKNPNK